MTFETWVISLAAAWIGFAFLSRGLLDNPREDVEGGLVWHTVRAYSALVHRLRVVGRENIPADRRPGPLILVANHTAGVDPVLIGAACPFHVRWVMARDMRHPWGEWLWRWDRIIFVSREGDEIAGVREALRALRDGEVIGVFPEGGIERPHGQVRPFLPGVGLLIRRSGAPVLPVVIEGTPDVDPAWHSLRRLSRSVVTFMPAIDYRATRLSAGEIVADLQRRFEEWVSGCAESGAVAGHLDERSAEHEHSRVRRPA